MHFCLECSIISGNWGDNMKNVNNVELLMERVNNFKDNLFVNVKISFLLEIMSKMGDIVYLDERLCSIIAKRYSKMK